MYSILFLRILGLKGGEVLCESIEFKAKYKEKIKNTDTNYCKSGLYLLSKFVQIKLT